MSNSPNNQQPPNALTIAGSDSGGGAGIQADLKTFAAFGVFGTSAITAVTAQNTQTVTSVQEIDLEVIAAQIDAVVSDIRIDVVKTGMLSSAAIVGLVADKAAEHGFEQLVVDPVMIAASGARLLREDSVETTRKRLFPLATVVTPNIPEAEVLADMEINGLPDMEEASRRIHGLGPKYVILKGGHLEDAEHSDDLLFDGESFETFSAHRIKTTSNHGTGCTFASAVASGLAYGRDINRSVADAKAYVTAAIANAFPVGKGHGPLNHFHHWWDS